MVTLDRIRLTGLLRKTLANAGVFYKPWPTTKSQHFARSAMYWLNVSDIVKPGSHGWGEVMV